MKFQGVELEDFTEICSKKS